MLKKLKLNRQFTLLSLIILVISSLVGGYLLWQAVQADVQAEMTSQAMILMKSADSVRHYTSQNIRPLLADKVYSQENFIPEIVPAFAARTFFNTFSSHEKFRHFSYKEATLNPTNSVDLADAYERQLITILQQEPDIVQISEYRPQGQFLIARPIKITSVNCLECHGSPEAAPPSLVASYGSDGGFGWKMGETVGAQIIYIPASTLYERTVQEFTWPFITMLGMFLGVVLVTNGLIQKSVIQPSALLIELAQKMEQWQFSAEDLNDARLLEVVERGDEIGTLSRSFRKMALAVDRHTAELSSLNCKLRSEIEEREQVERALRLSQETQRAVFNAIPDMIFCLDRSGVYLSYKPGRKMKAALAPELFLGRSMYDLWPATFAAEFMQHANIALDTNQEVVWEYRLPLGADNKLAERDNEARILPLGSDQLLVLVRDITEDKQLEQSLLQAQKLKSVGLLAGGIAHDFNNLLTGILGQTSLALSKMDEDDKARIHVSKAVASAERAANLTRQLLAYAGKGQLHIVKMNLNELLNEQLALLEMTLPQNAEMELALAETALYIEADVGQMQQVIMNLVINAAEALGDEGGRVQLRTDFVEIDPTIDLTTFVKEPPHLGKFVLLEVSDTGHGIKPELLERIFDPYFTTKLQGRGLGLSATLGVIHNCNGYLQVISQVESGTTMRVYLPPTSAPLSVAPSPRSEITAAGSPHTILIVDDDKGMRGTMAFTLKSAGYKTLCASNGYQAVELYQKYGNSIDVIVLDLHMPLMSGQATYEALLKIDSQFKLIALSGYVNVASITFPKREHVIGMLQKPFNVETLVKMVHKARQEQLVAV